MTYRAAELGFVAQWSLECVARRPHFQQVVRRQAPSHVSTSLVGWP